MRSRSVTGWGLRLGVLGLVFVVSLLPRAAIGGLARQSANLIQREQLLGPAARSLPAVSPDGRMLAYLASDHGVMNVWVAPLAAIDRARCITHATARPITAFTWAPDSQRILYLQDHDGDENEQLFGAPLSAGDVVDYTPFAGTTTSIVAVSPLIPGEILIALNKRDPHWPDVYRLTLATGSLRLAWSNPGGYRGFVADRSLILRLGEKTTAQGGYQVDRFLPDGSVHTLLQAGFEDSQTTAVASVAMAAGKVFLLDSRGRDTTAIESIDLAGGAIHVLASNPRVDIAANSDGGVGGDGTLIVDPRTGEVLAYSVNDLNLKWIAIGPTLKADIASLDRNTGGQWSLSSQSADNILWTLSVDRPGEATSYYLFDRSHSSLRRLFSSRPELEGRALSAMEAVAIQARDGKRLVSYLSLPALAGSRPGHPLPAVLLVHGGPDERNVYGYNEYHQWLASRGYAVLSVNYRGSTGFGKVFTNSRAWSEQVSNDLVDGVNWLIAHKIARADRIGIVGGSYGGYATLAGLATKHSVYACGVDYFGPTNLVDLLDRNSVPPQWNANYEHLVRVFGDPRTAEGRAYLTARSPGSHADELAGPLLVAQGANDPRVRRSQSDRFVAELDRRGVSVTYAVFPDEGHGFVRSQNALGFAAVAEAFLHRCLGGELQPIEGALRQSSMQVPVGADRIQSLGAALRSVYRRD